MPTCLQVHVSNVIYAYMRERSGAVGFTLRMSRRPPPPLTHVEASRWR